MYFVQRLVFPTDFTLLSPYDSAEKVGQSSEPQHMERLRKGSVLVAGAATPSLGLLTSFGNYCYPVVDSFASQLKIVASDIGPLLSRCI
ncbi:hypothetical protein DAPPUDRAFT_312465 [Daphnia pulex]|uniref:Uncharacterized protein n=1 Tax=Daphnia pulex TaxID=6669 RepID=E9G0Y0_DAPPU|nr:hypothetical protein DAPPUDRAFT_312465 [Daphnia pulex]|eukprot:EFX86982.1 hypothetical protein DAPPUDRAFT_312465 [Daphnia pulex]